VLALAAALALGPVAARAGQTLVALGDSLTQGYGLPQGEGFVPQLEAWLRAQGADVRVVNAGVSGDTTAGGLSRLDWTLAEGADAMIVALGGNDLLRGIDPDVSRANLDQILARATGQGVDVLLVPMEAPGNYGPDYRDRFDAIFPDLSARYGVPLGPSFLAPIVKDIEDAAAVRALMQSDGLHPSAEGVARIVEALGPHVLKLLARAAGAAPAGG
jgi:acyl-CoA thioesterase-1